MTDSEKQTILREAKTWWRDVLVEAHRKNTLKLTKVEEFSINPFLLPYLANYFSGRQSAQALAQVLIYPRVLGPSITTTFGGSFQKFITQVFGNVQGSQIKGIDIEFVDQTDKKLKYCQLKAGPKIVNHDGVKTIKDHFGDARRTARQNSLPVDVNDYMLCLLYGEPWQKNQFIKQIEKDYTVAIGQDFWHRLTGDKNFYSKLINAITEVAQEPNLKSTVAKVVDQLAKDIKKNYPDMVR